MKGTKSKQSARVPSREGRIPELDGLRGVAIALVVVTHCLNITPVPGESTLLTHGINFLIRAKSFTWSGVDLFFILSGFLIGGKLLETVSTANYYTTFYKRRARRILPIYLLFLCLTALCYVFVYPSNARAMALSLDHPPLPWYLYLTFVANIWMACYSTFGARPLSVLWSLAVEEQFYMIAPFLVRKIRTERLPLFLIVGIVGSLLLRCSLQLVHNHDMTVYVLLPCRINALLWGIFGAWCFRTPEVWNFLGRYRSLMWITFYLLGSGICAGSFLTGSSSTITETLGYDWLALFYLTALGLVLIDRNSWLGRLVRRSCLMQLGVISYCLYLIHYTVYVLTMGFLLGRSGPVQNLSDLGAALFSIMVAIGLAMLSWNFFEKPILNAAPGATLHIQSKDLWCQ